MATTKTTKRSDPSQRSSVSLEVNQGLAPCSEEVVGVVPGFCLLAFQCANRVCLTRADHCQGGMQAVVLISMYVPRQSASIRAMLADMPPTLPGGSILFLSRICYIVRNALFLSLFLYRTLKFCHGSFRNSYCKGIMPDTSTYGSTRRVLVCDRALPARASSTIG